MKKIDEEKRKFLKLVGVGSLGLLLAQFLENNWDTVISQTTFKNFKLVETHKDLKLFTASGEEIITFEKDE